MSLQATGWIAHNQQYDFDDYGLTIDAGLALDEVGAPASVVGNISDAVAAHLDDYVSGYGTILSGALEDSNVDIAEELTSMIESQRNYTANSKVFQTGSELMDVLVNLVR